MEGLFVRGRGDVINVRPLLLRAGMAFALSFAGYLLASLRPRFGEAARRRRLSGTGENGGGWRSIRGLKDELHLIKIEELSPKVVGGVTTSAIVVLLPITRSSVDEEGYLLPEFNRLVLKELAKEPDTLTATSAMSPKKSPDIQEAAATTMEQEVSILKSKLQLLQERERKLESQLLEFYSHREQETIVRELENCLKINAVEAELFALKIESLQAENRRLEAQLSDYLRAVTELDSAKTKIKIMKWKMRSNSEKAGETIASLERRLVELKEGECKAKQRDDAYKHSLLKLKDLEEANVRLCNENSQLAQQNLHLIEKLKSSNIVQVDLLDDPEKNFICTTECATSSRLRTRRTMWQEESF